jgi:hypothetical protein
MTENNVTIREAVGVFDDLEKMQEAIAELETLGFERRHISVLGSEAAMKDTFGKPQKSPEKLEDNSNAPRSANIAPEDVGVAQGVIVGGGTAAGIAAAVVASGGLLVPGAAITSVIVGGVGGVAVGSVFAKILGDKYSEFFQKQIDKGGLLLWVQTDTIEKENTASKVLQEYGAEDVHIHDIKSDS